MESYGDSTMPTSSPPSSSSTVFRQMSGFATC